MREGFPARVDDRAVSTTVGYVLTLAITATLISGLLIAGGSYLEQQQEAVARDELAVVGDQLAGGFVDADRLASSGDGDELRVRVWLPTRVVGSPYTISVTNVSSSDGGPYLARIVASSDAAGVSASVTLRTTFAVANRTVKGGPVTIVHRDTDDSDHERELVINHTTVTVPPPQPENMGHEEIVFVSQDKGLSSIDPTGDNEVTRYDVPSTVQAIGPKKIDFDRDGLREIPYVNSSGAVKLVDENGQIQTLATGADTSKTLLAAEKWRGEFSVFYVGASEHEIYRVTLGESPVEVSERDLAAYAVAGVMDMNGDGDRDIVYTNSNQQIYYLDGGDEHKADNGAVGENNGIGVGEPKDFDGSGTMRVPAIDTSNNVVLYRQDTGKEDIGDNGEKTPVAGIQWNTSHAGLEVVYVDSTDSTLHYVTSDGAYVTQILAADGTSIEVDTAVGVA